MRASAAMPRAGSITRARPTASPSRTTTAASTSRPGARSPPGEELTYDYRLSLDGRITRKIREEYACRCGARRCRGPLLLETIASTSSTRWPANAAASAFRHDSSSWSTSRACSPTIRSAIRIVRKLAVWLPPQYDEGATRGRGRRFPVLYDLVGFTGSGLAHVELEAVRRQRPGARRRGSSTSGRWGRRSSCSPTASPRSAATSTSIRPPSAPTPIT